MDEASEDELALSNLHHGLESSFDEDMNGSGKLDMRPVHHSNSVDSHSGDMASENHIHSLQDMVLEMKQGFQAALQELAKIQDKEEAEDNHSHHLQQQQQRQLDHMTETIVEIKEKLSSLTRNVEQIMDDQKTLKSRLDEVAPSRDSSQDNKMSVNRGSSKRPSLVDDNSAHSQEWNLQSTSQPTETGTHRTRNEGAAIACKGSSLTQALGEECLKLNLSQSSNDEEDDEQLLRLSRYGHKTGHHVFSQTTDRQHNKSGIPGPQDRHKTIINAAQRQKSVMELADSERDYTSQLWSLLRTYLTPLQTAGFLSARELDTLFPVYLEQLYAEHCHMCTGLQDRLIHWTYTATVSDLLERFTDSYNSESLLTLYKEYADDLPAALSCLRRAQAKSSEFRSFLKAVQHSSCQSESLMSLLMAPFQRIPKLLQQLQEVCRHTPATHTDFPHLQSLLHQLQLFVDQLNDDLFHTAQDLNSDKQISRSDYMNGHGLNGRDSGIHSNSTEEDNLMSARALSKTRRSYVSSEWLDDSCYGAKRQQPWSPSGRASALSQPDLTVYSMDRMATDPLEYAHIPRSQSALPTADGDNDGSEAAARRQVQKFKIKRRYPSPVGYTTTPDHNHSSLSSRVRPSSAVDFLSQSQHQHYHKHNSGDVCGGARSYQHPGPKPRPQSALGPHNLNSSHRPVVISRKNIRRPQPSVSTSNTSWSETKTSSALPVRAGHQNTNLTAEDLFPAFSIPQRRADVFNGHDGDDDDDDDDDDTRASDAISCDMYEYHRNSHSHGVGNHYEIGHLPQGHVSYQMVKNSSLAYDTAKSTESIAENITDDPLKWAFSGKKETATDNRGIRRGSKDQQNPKSISVLRYQPSQSVTSQRNDKSDIKALHVSQAEAKDIERPTGNFAHIPGLEQRSAKEQTTLNESSLLNEVFFNGNNSAASVSSSGFNVSQEGDEPSTKRHIVKVVPKPDSAIDHHAEIDRSKQVLDTNRQFLLMLSNRTSTMSKGDLAHPVPAGANVEHSGGNVVEISNKSPTTSDTSESFSSDHTSVSRRVLPYIPPRHKIPNSQVNQAPITTTTINQGSTKPSLPMRKHMKPCASSLPAGQDGSQAPLDITDSESLLKYDHNSPQTMFLSSTTYPQSPSIPSQDASILSQISLSLEHQNSSIRPMPLFTSSTASMSPSPAELPVPSKANGQNPDDRIYSSSHDPQPLNLADLDANGEKGRRRGSLKYKMKDEGSNLSSDNYSMASEDQANVRRKMHFKASLKNLFAKKKGRVVLADIERQVVMEMASTGATGGAGGSTPTSVASPALKNIAHSSSRHLANIKGSQTGDIGTSHKTSGKPLTEVKSQKDQGSSTSSPSKMYERIKFRTRSEKDATNVSGGEQIKITDCEQNREKNMLKCLSLRNKRHGIILENPDTDLEKILEAGGDSVRSSEQGSSSSRHSYTQDRTCSNQSHLLPRPHSEVMACAAYSDGAKSHAKPGDKRILLEQIQDPNYLRNCMEIRKAATCEPDLLQFASGYKSNNHKIAHTICKDSVVSSSGASDNELSSQRSTGYRHKDHDLKKPQLSGFDLCLQCQKNELRQMETTEAVDSRSKFGSCELPEGSVEMSEKVSDNARNYPRKIVPECRSFGDGSYTVGQASSHPRCMLHGVWNPRPPTEQIKQFSYTDEPAVSSSADSADDKLEDETYRNTTTPDTFPGSSYVHRMKKEKLGDRPRFSTLLPVYEQPSPKSSQAAHSMPDVAKCSTLVANWSDNLVSCSSPENTQVSDQPASLLGNNAGLGQRCGLELSNTLDTQASLISSASTEFVTNIQVSSSPFHVSSLHQNPSGKLDHHVSESHPLASVETVSGETILHNQLPTTTNEVSPKCDPNQESCKNPARAEGGSEILVKCSSLEDRESFEHRYRLYYDDDATDASKLHSLLENPKSLKVLSASCVIREHFRQSPWNETSSCFKNHPPSSEQLPLLTLEVPVINIRDQSQQTSNRASYHEGCADANPDGQNVAVYTARHLPYSNGIGTAVVNICRSQTSTQLSVDSSFPGRLSLHNPTDLANNTGVFGTGSSHKDRLDASDNNPSAIHSKRDQGVMLKLNDNETSLKLPPGSHDCQEDAKNVKAVVLENYQGHFASSAAVDDDESNSYKPKNPRPVSQIPSVVECQTAECFRRDVFGSEDSPGAPETGVSSKHSPILESEAAVSSSYTKLTSLNHEPILHSDMSQAAGKTYNQLHSHIQADQSPLYVESCTARRSWSFSKGRDPSSKDVSSEASTRAASPVVYFCKQSAEDPFIQEGCTFLRTSSPYDPTTLRMNFTKTPSGAPKDQAESINSPRTMTPISPEADRTNTKDITKSMSKEVPVEKEDKVPRHTNYGRMKATFDEDNTCQKSCKKWVSADGSSFAPSSNHNGISRRHRHSNGSKFRCQDQQFYQSQNPRYSADSNPLIQTAFLQKMACLPEYMIKQGGNFPVDEKTSYTTKATSRHTKIHFDVTRKSYGPIDGKSSRTARNNPPSKASLSGVSSEPTEADPGHSSYENYHQRTNTGSAAPDIAQASPDLLPSKEPSREDANAKDKTSACKKAQSFFSKLTNSPMSFFYKEPKPSYPPN